MYIPKSERDSMIAIDTTPEIYLVSGMEPCSRFAAYQSVHFPISSTFREGFIETLIEKDPKWIIRPCGKALLFPEIEDFIRAGYQERFSESTYCFYRRNDTPQD